MGHLEGNFTPILYIGRKVPKVNAWILYRISPQNQIIIMEGKDICLLHP